MISLKNKKIGVLCGGTSSEREISLMSGKAVYEAIKKLGFDVDKAIELKTSVEDKPKTEAHVRRVTTKSEPKVTGRRVVTNGQK